MINSPAYREHKKKKCRKKYIYKYFIRTCTQTCNKLGLNIADRGHDPYKVDFAYALPAYIFLNSF